MIRFILVILTAFLYLILSIPVLLVLLLIRKKKPEVCDKVSRSLIRWIFRVILFFSGTKITVKGQENIPKDRAVLYIGNHRSYFDILVTYTTVPGSCGFVAKKELSRIPLLKNWMELIHCLFLDRSDIKQGLQMILSGCEEIKSGTSICIFPEVPAARRRASWSSASSTTVHSRWQRKPAARSFRFRFPDPEKFWKHISRRSAVPTLP